MEQLKNNKVIYTAIYGKYDTLKEISVPDGWDCICYTDDSKCGKDSKVWEIRVIKEPLEEKDVVRERSVRALQTLGSRKMKLLPHRYLEDYEYSVWIDASIALRNDIIKELAGRNIEEFPDFGVWQHPDRNCIYAEAKACISMGKDCADIINNQMASYRNHGCPEKLGLTHNGVLMRRHMKEDLISFSEQWWSELVNWSFRDQLSFSYVKNINKGIDVEFLIRPKSEFKKYFSSARHRKV